MAAFWLLFLLAAYGVFGGYPLFVNGWLVRFGVDTTPWVTQVPIVGNLSPATVIALITQGVVALVIYRILSRPRAVRFLVETEGEMRKVKWPGWHDTRNGALAVILTVSVMLVFLLAVDAFFLRAFSALFRLKLGG